ncbi:MAG: ABC transporter ATP-binding protein [Acidobacteriota bacterium]|nr:MAG: ABC transporter ATP-binding protein [Acidobacteriota bacterium]
MKTQSTVIQTTNLTKDYEVGSFSRKKLRALDHLELAVEEGETFGLIGPNGAGKTTTLKLLMGLVFPTEGEAKILGKPIDCRDAKSEIGYLPEQPYFYDYLSGRELLNYFGQLFGLSRTERSARVEELLDKVGMTASADVPLRKYSKGMTQRLGIAQALVNRPKVVFFDEPMSGLDPIGRREMTLLIRELRDSGVTVFFCSHILPDVEQLCDRVAILNKGKLVEIGRLSEILDVSIQTIEVEVENLSEALISELRDKTSVIEKSGTRARIVFTRREDFDAALGPLTGGEARLVSVTPVKQSLEEHFVAEVSGEGLG